MGKTLEDIFGRNSAVMGAAISRFEKEKVDAVCEKLGFEMPGGIHISMWPRPIFEVMADRIVQLELANLATVNRVRKLQATIDHHDKELTEALKIAANLTALVEDLGEQIVKINRTEMPDLPADDESA